MRIGRTVLPAAAPIYFRDLINGIRAVFKGQSELERFEREVREHFRVKHSYLVSSGRAALTITLKALHRIYPNRCEVIIPAFCCYSVPAAIVRAGLKVRLCDIDPATLDFNYAELIKIAAGYDAGDLPPANEQEMRVDHGSCPKYCTKSTKASPLLAIVPVHLFGLAADVERIAKIVKDPDVSIVEDAAQVFGVASGGKKLGTIGDVGIFSFGRGKSITAVKGGVIVTNNDQIGQQVKLQMTNTVKGSIIDNLALIAQGLGLFLFQNPSLFWFPKSIPSLRVGETIYDTHFKINRMAPFQAGVAKTWRTKIERFQKLRSETSQRWRKLLSLGFFSGYNISDGGSPSFIRFPIRILNRSLWQYLLGVSESKGLGVMLTYPDAINNIEELKQLFDRENYPGAQEISRQLLTLPVHPMLSDRDKDKIAFYLNKIETISEYGSD